MGHIIREARQKNIKSNNHEWIPEAIFVKLKNKHKGCEKCGVALRWNQKHVHHIKYVSHGGTNELSNLQILCRKCHQDIHKNDGEKQ